MAAYYNEIDPKAAAWLRELIRCGHIVKGEVDERSILEVSPADLRGFTQCHFFAGIGVWSYALRLAGWPDDRPVWTGSCPCQPFSAAGKGDEFADERHLWPAWFRLARELRPDAIFGEQVSSKDALAWFDHVRVDLEGEGYAIGILDTCAAGVGAPHIRQRLYFVADSSGEGQRPRNRRRAWGSDEYWRDVERCGRVGDTSGPGSQTREPENLPGAGRREEGRAAVQSGPAGGMGKPDRVQPEQPSRERARPGDSEGGRPCGESTGPGATNGFWADADWLPCRDGKARPTEPGTFPLVTGASARVVRLRGYGNAINAEQAKEFILAFRDVTECS